MIGLRFTLFYCLFIEFGNLNFAIAGKLYGDERIATSSKNKEQSPTLNSRFFDLGNMMGSLFGNIPTGSQFGFGGNVRGVQPAIFLQQPVDQQIGGTPNWNNVFQGSPSSGFNNEGQELDQGFLAQTPYDRQNFDSANRYPNVQNGNQNRVPSSFQDNPSQQSINNQRQFGKQGSNLNNNQGAGYSVQVPTFSNQESNIGNAEASFGNQAPNFNSPDSSFNYQEPTSSYNYQESNINKAPSFINQESGFDNQGLGESSFDKQNQGTNNNPGIDNNQSEKGNQNIDFGRQGFDESQNQETSFINKQPGNGYQRTDFDSQGSRPNQNTDFVGLGLSENTNWPQNYADSSPNDLSLLNQTGNGLVEVGKDFNSQGQDYDEDPVAIRGKPVIVPTVTTPAGRISFDNSPPDSPIQRQCVQDCRTTSEYDPVCGTNNITYFNPARFRCARNCGIQVFVQHQGRCDRPNNG